MCIVRDEYGTFGSHLKVDRLVLDHVVRRPKTRSATQFARQIPVFPACLSSLTSSRLLRLKYAIDDKSAPLQGQIQAKDERFQLSSP